MWEFEHVGGAAYVLLISTVFVLVFVFVFIFVFVFVFIFVFEVHVCVAYLNHLDTSAPLVRERETPCGPS